MTPKTECRTGLGPLCLTPTRFNGDCKRFHRWKLETEGKLRRDIASIGDTAMQVLYIHSCLDNPAQDISTPFYEQKRDY